MKKTLLLLTVILMITPVLTPVLGESVDHALIASTENYPDAFIASPASAKLGTPVILTDIDELPEEAKNTLEDFNVTNVTLLGGPLVISEEVEEELESMGFSVTRLWGVSRYGTAAEVAEHFWSEGNEEAVIATNDLDSNHPQPGVVASAKKIAVKREAPLLLTPSDQLPAIVLSSLQEMNVSYVTLIGTSIGQNITDELSSLNITVQETIQYPDLEELKEEIRKKINFQIKIVKVNQTTGEVIEEQGQEPEEELVVVAAANFTHAILDNHNPNSTSYLVSSEEQIPGVVEHVNSYNITMVKVVGKPDLAELIGETLENQTNATVTVMTGKPGWVNRQVKKEKLQAFIKQKIKYQQWVNQTLQHQEKIKNRITETLNKTEKMWEGEENQLQAKKNQIEKKMKQNKLVTALRLAKKLETRARLYNFNQIQGNWTEISEQLSQEVQTLQEKVGELTQINQEFGEEMSQNLTVKEKLQVVKGFKYQRREKVKETVQQATSVKQMIKGIIGKETEENGEAEEEEIEGVEEEPSGEETPGNQTEAPEVLGNLDLMVSDLQADISDFDSLITEFSKARVFRLGEATLNETGTTNISTGGFEELSLNKSRVDLTQVIGEKAISVLNVNLEEGTYTKVELHVSNVNGTVNDSSVEVMVPSEKLQIVKTFEIQSDQTTTLVFDIQVVKKGIGGGYNLLPVISKSGVVGEDLAEGEVEEIECTVNEDCDEDELCLNSTCVEQEEEEDGEGENGETENGGETGNQTEEPSITVSMEEISFNPSVLNITEDTTVTWTNEDTVNHTVTELTNTFGSGDLSPGENFTYTFGEEGTYVYSCDYHPTMKGTIIVAS